MSINPEAIVEKTDLDITETKEWLDALQGVMSNHSDERAAYLIDKQIQYIRVNGVTTAFNANTPYVNTIPPEKQPAIPGNSRVEHRIRAYTRWNSMAMVLRANKDTNVGGHIASFQSAATLYDVGFNHFWQAPNENQSGDLIFFQGHSSPGIYARAFLLGRLTEQNLDNFRQEVNGGGLSSYPHPWLMPDFWQFPTVSMGLGPIMAIYQARFMNYLQDRGIVDNTGRKVWCFLGDGETDEPESLGAIGMAGREKLDNLVFVVNCNLQRLDGPVRGNGKIVQELEGEFRGSGWNVIKVLWGTKWDTLFAKDTKGLLIQRFEQCVDGEFQMYRSKDGAFVREYFFNTPELKELVIDWSDDDIWALNRGGHDPHKIYAAFKEASEHKGQPTVILAKTIKGYGMGSSGEAQNITHQQKKMSHQDLINFRNRYKLPINDEDLEKLPYLKFEEGSEELEYMRNQRMKLGGYLPRRIANTTTLAIPSLSTFDALLQQTAEGREISTTMAFVRMLNTLLKDKEIGKRIVPIVPDESRTFGMEGMFRQLGIWSHVGQLYTPHDHDQLMFYKEDKQGQILQEGINEAGAMCDWIAAGTAYSSHGVTMIPFYIFYSMFGFQRVGDLCWAAADMRTKGFLLGGTAGRTTLNGEGLQHEDGHSHIMSATVPNCISYDPTYAYEVAVIVQNGLERMYKNNEDIYYYITLMNENYSHPSMPVGAESGILKGMYLFSKIDDVTSSNKKVQLLGSGTIFREVLHAAELLQQDWGVSSDIWSCPSFTELAREGQSIHRNNMLNPLQEAQVPYVEQCLGSTIGPVIAATDYVRAYSEQIRAFIPKRYVTLGTDGFGRSDTREQLRHFFEVNRYWITVASLKALADDKIIGYDIVDQAIKKYNLDINKPNPMTV